MIPVATGFSIKIDTGIFSFNIKKKKISGIVGFFWVKYPLSRQTPLHATI
jgi:hypothetical protein